MSRVKVSDDEFAKYVAANSSIAGVLRNMNLAPVGGNYKTVKSRIHRMSLSTSHMDGQGHLRGKTHNWSKKIDLREILVENSTYTTTSFLRNRLIKEGLFKDECSMCGLSIWLGKKLSLHLDHINGINNDNRLENLRILCPNCHSLTETYCGKNKRRA